MIIACSGGKHLARKIAKKSKSYYGELESERFPDSELRVRIPDVKGKKIYFVQSFYKQEDSDVNDKLVEVLFAAKTAKELKAKKVFLIAPYLSYMREDARFRNGESISAKILAKLFSFFDKIYVVEPHLHRFKRFDDFFPNAVRVKISEEIASYVKKKVKGNFLIVGPDQESEQWVKPIADITKSKYSILSKQRFHSRKVKVKGKKVEYDNVILVDDIISTGHTLMQASKLVKAKNVYYFGVHGIFAEGALKKLNKSGKVIVSNTIPTSASKFDCTDAIVEAIK